MGAHPTGQTREGSDATPQDLHSMDEPKEILEGTFFLDHFHHK